MIAWRDLPGLRDPDRFDAWLRRLLVRSCIAEAQRERRLVTDPCHSQRAPQRYGRLRQRGRSGRAGSGLSSTPPGAARNSRAAPLRRTRNGGDRRCPRHPARHGPLSTSPCPPRDARRPRGGRPRDRDRRTVRMTPQRDIERVLERWLDRRHQRDARPGLPLDPRSRGAPAPAARVARLLEGLLREHVCQAARCRRGGRRDRRWRHRDPRTTVRLRRRRRRFSGCLAGTRRHRRPRRLRRPPRRRRPRCIPRGTPTNASGAGFLPAGRQATQDVHGRASTFTVPEGWVNSGDAAGFFGLFPDTPANAAEFAASDGLADAIHMGPNESPYSHVR